MVDSSREVIGAVLKYMGVSYNTKDIEKQAFGGRKEVLRNLRMLQRQVCCKGCEFEAFDVHSKFIST